MSGILLLDRANTAAAIDPTRLLGAVSEALVALSRDEVSAPPRVAARSPAGVLGAMPAYVPGQGLAAKLVSVFEGVGPEGQSAHRGVVVLFDEKNGTPLALMDAEVITALRTAATATVAMLALAPPSPSRIAVLGAGTQARSQLSFLSTVAIGGEVVLGARDLTRAASLVAEYPGVSVATVESAVNGANVVLCCTSAQQPILRRAWITRGAHVSSVGGSGGPELDAETVRGAALFVEWRGALSEPPPAGAYELQEIEPSRAELVGAVLSGRHRGRQANDELTVFKSTGHAALDVAAARVAYDVALEHGIGSVVAL